MVDREQLLELVPHYLAMLVLVFLALGLARAAVGEIDLWIEFLVVLVVVVLYRPLVKYLGLEPSLWKR